MFYIKCRSVRPLMQYGRRLGLFAELALRARLTTARVFSDKQIDTWAMVVKENGIKAD